MRELHFPTPDGDQAVVNLPEPTGNRTFFVLSLAKAGSTLLHQMVGDLCSAAGRAEFSLPGVLFQEGVPLAQCPAEAAAVLNLPGYVFTGFRAATLAEDARAFATRPKLLLVRDPRDIAVSHYFSIARSHGIPSGPLGERMQKAREEAARSDANEHVASGAIRPILINMRRYKELVETQQNWRVLRYEDIIFKKRSFAVRLAKFLQIDLPTEKLNEIADQHDIVPDEERPDQHVRQVTPGNYKQHLTPCTIKAIERDFADIFDYLGYETEPA